MVIISIGRLEDRYHFELGVGVMEEAVGKYTMAVAVSLTGVEAHRIRRYERMGLLKPMRTGGGQRLYSDADLERIREISSLEEQGVNLKGIGMILAMRHENEGENPQD